MAFWDLLPSEPADTDPTKLGLASLDLARKAGNLSVYGSAFSSLPNVMAYLYRGKVANQNAAIARANAEAATAAGTYAEGTSRIRTGQYVASQKAAQAAGNIDVGSGSPVTVRQATEKLGEADALAIRYNAAREAWAARSEASQQSAEARLSQFGALSAFTKGAGDTYASYLSASSALINRRLQLEQMGAINASS